MPLEKDKKGIWFREELYSDFSQSVKVNRVLLHRKTKFQDLYILDTARFGKMLVLDGIFQTTERDEKYYHEPLAHCALFSHPNPKRILVIGGGDGGLVKQLVKHPVKVIDLVDIDQSVIDLTKKYLPSLAGKAWNDPRVKVHIEDGARFVKKVKNKYDVILVDSPDPVGPAVSLFQTSFYLDCKKALSRNGLIVRQTGSTVLQPEEMPTNFRQMEESFPEVSVFLTAVPTYIGGYFSFVAGANQKGLFTRSWRQLQPRFQKLKLETDWYTPQMHQASQVLPRELQSSLKKTEYGQELVVDLYDCDYSVITSREKLRQFARRMCEVIKMKPYGEPFVADFGFSMSKTAGPSLVQLIESSSITAHYSPHWRIVCLNIFTCTSFEAQKALNFAKKFFGSRLAVAYLVKRGGRAFGRRTEIIDISAWRSNN